MKKTMNSRDVAKFHKYLDQDISIEKCSKALGVDKVTLKKFTPEAVAKAKGAKPAVKPAAAAA